MSTLPDRYAVIGNPIAQSKSPLIHGLFAQATAQQIEYDRVEGHIGEFGSQVDALRHDGLQGLNVTAPFKLDAFSYATRLSQSARLAGAVNAMKFEAGQAWGDNFDGVGLVHDIEVNLACPLQGKRLLLLGAGGAVRGALLPFARCQPELLVVANRTPAKALELVTLLHDQSAVSARACSFEDINGAFDVVVNGTSASLFDAVPAVPMRAFGDGCLAYEMAYGKGSTPFLKLAREAGAAVLADGVGMLVEQAAWAFEWWRGVRPDTRPVIEHIRVPI